MVEQTISRSLEARPDMGLAVWTPRQLRDIDGFLDAESLWDEEGKAVDDAAVQAIDRIKAQLLALLEQERAAGTQILVITEENLIGSMRRNFHFGRFYPGTERRQAAFARLMPFQPDVLALGMRNYGAAWTSARDYAHQRGFKRVLKEDHRKALPDLRRGWVEVVKAAQAAWPDTKMITWCQEDLRDHAREIVAGLLGIAEADIVVPKRPVNAVKDHERQDPLFTQAELDKMQARYEADVLRLQHPKFALHWVPSVTV